MAQQFSAEWARGVIDGGVEKAKGLMEDPQQMEALLASLQEKVKGLPDTVATAFENVPLMASMVKSYITREYTEVSPKVIISLVSAFVYFVKQKDLIPDNVPVLGYADDIAVATIAMAINERELAAFAEWREQRNAEAPEAAVQVQAEPPVAEAAVAEATPQAQAEPPAAEADVQVQAQAEPPAAEAAVAEEQPQA